jgi:hypothetical protein
MFVVLSFCFSIETQEGIPVRPIENTIRAPTRNISKFLDEILRPIFNDRCKTTTIIDGSHLNTELHTNYIKKGLLKSTTLFCTIDVRNLFTMLPQDEALNILMEFLNVHGYRKVKGINLDTIRKLASIVLKENAFAYGKKNLQTNNWWCYEFIIHINFSKHFHVEMAKGIGSYTRYDR